MVEVKEDVSGKRAKAALGLMTLGKYKRRCHGTLSTTSTHMKHYSALFCFYERRTCTPPRSCPHAPQKHWQKPRNNVNKKGDRNYITNKQTFHLANHLFVAIAGLQLCALISPVEYTRVPLARETGILRTQPIVMKDAQTTHQILHGSPKPK
jgi:hypothetical protein